MLASKIMKNTPYKKTARVLPWKDENIRVNVRERRINEVVQKMNKNNGVMPMGLYGSTKNNDFEVIGPGAVKQLNDLKKMTDVSQINNNQ